MNNYAVIGTGGVGGYYGARLAESGKNVHFIARSDNDSIQKLGLSIKSYQGNFSLLSPSVHRSAETVPPVDAVVLTVKTTANTAIVPELKKLIGPQTILILLQNGYGEEEFFADLFPTTKIITGLCFICSARLSPGVIDHQAAGSVVFAEYSARNPPAGVTPLLKELEREFSSAHIPVTLEADFVLARWKKLVWNIPYNGLSVLLKADTAAMMQNPASRKLVTVLMKEVQIGAAACGRTIPDSYIEQMLAYTDGMPPYLPSMRLDYDAKREMEVVSMYENPLAASRKNGVDLPAIATLALSLSFLNNFSSPE